MPQKIKKSSKRVQRYFELARRMAKESTYGKLRHGAVLVKGGSVVSVGFNKGCYCAFGQRFRDFHNFGHATQHAEISAILGVPEKSTRGASLFVVRINNYDKFRMSKPCCMCHQVLDFVGVRKVFYTTGEDTYEVRNVRGTDEEFRHNSKDFA
jgi:deoxycytidylate deaminase